MSKWLFKLKSIAAYLTGSLKIINLKEIKNKK